MTDTSIHFLSDKPMKTYVNREKASEASSSTCPACESGVPTKEVVPKPMSNTEYKLVERKLLWDMEDYEIRDEEDIFEEYDTERMKEDLGETIRHHFKTDKLLVSASNINWRGSKGYKVIDITKESSIFNSLIPDYDCSFRLYQEGENIYAIVSSHDVPTGSTWSMYGVKDVEKELEDLVYHIGDGSHGYNKQYFFNKVTEKFNMPVGDWERTDITDKFLNIQKGVHVLAIGIDRTFQLWLDENDNICDTIDYDVDKFAEDYYDFIINS